MINRRASLSLLAALPALLALPSLVGLPIGFVQPARASAAGDSASAFIKATGAKLVAAINATSGSPAQRRQVVGEIIGSTVDVDGVARFCLGRFWRTASPAQQQQYLSLFHTMLVVNIASKLGDYQGVTFTVGGTQDRDSGEVVSTVIERPNNAPTNIQWLVADAATNPKIIDVIAEGTSMRLTQRDDYASFLSQHASNVDALIAALRNQLSQAG
jgi:phospholipid transport system substrate-binding protein